jgi:GT-D fold-like domain
MTFYKELLQNCPPLLGSAFGRKEDGYDARLAQAKILSELMRRRRPFCFLRMGDMELAYLLAQQYNHLDRIEFQDGPTSGTQAYCNPGLSARHAERLRRAYEGADYVDFHEQNWPNHHLVSRLVLQRAPGSYRNPTKETSLVFLTWTEKEFRHYCKGRRIGFAGAEARLLELLSQTPEFKRAAADYRPDSAVVFYHQPRNDGQNIDANLDLVKEDLREFVGENRVDTLFLSLGGGAKILGYELSRELGICCFDFGAMIRAFTYSGCDGNRSARSPHSPFLFRIPFGTYMDALERAFPSLTPAELLAKAHAQLLLELVKKEVGWTSTSWEFDFNSENTSAFHRAFREYKKRYKKLSPMSPLTKKERSGFLHFCGTHGLTLEGRVFLLFFRLKGFVRRCLGFSR